MGSYSWSGVRESKQSLVVCVWGGGGGGNLCVCGGGGTDATGGKRLENSLVGGGEGYC